MRIDPTTLDVEALEAAAAEARAAVTRASEEVERCRLALARAQDALLPAQAEYWPAFRAARRARWLRDHAEAGAEVYESDDGARCAVYRAEGLMEHDDAGWSMRPYVSPPVPVRVWNGRLAHAYDGSSRCSCGAYLGALHDLRALPADHDRRLCRGWNVGDTDGAP